MKKVFFILGFWMSAQAVAQDVSYSDVVKQEILSNQLENSEASLKKPYVIMVSIDGFRSDYAKKHQAKNILSLAKNGSSTTRLIPSFPSKTFPNHYSLATGLYPAHHGIVSNTFYDKKTNKKYSIGNRDAVENGNWYGGIPLWNLAQTQGMSSASFYWVGSEADINGMHPKYYYRYNQKTPYEYRIKRVLEWLQLPEKVRPHMITLYFSQVDSYGHRFGPNAKETASAVQYVDAQIGALREGLKKLNLPVYLIVTGDHGMDNVSKSININQYVDVDSKQFISGEVAMMYTQNKKETDALYDKLSQQTLFKTYKKEAVPNYLHYNNNDRIGDLVLIADTPYTIINSKKETPLTIKPGGTHGYDPYENKKMGTIFYIEGPRIKKDFVLSAIENVNIYPLVAHLLGLKVITPIDGTLNATKAILKD